MVFRLVRDKSTYLDEMQELPHQLAALLEREVAASRLHRCLHRFTEDALLLRSRLFHVRCIRVRDPAACMVFGVFVVVSAGMPSGGKESVVMTDQNHYSVLGLEPGAKQEEIGAAFEEQLAARKARRGRTSDLHAANAVLGDPTLRRAYDAARIGHEAGARLAGAKDSVVDFAKDVAPDVDWIEVARSAWQTSLKMTVVVAGVAVKVADATSAFSRRVQSAAAQQIDLDR